MKSRFLLLIFAAAAISSCSTAYKSGQTPDDVYYSPGRESEEYVETRQDDRPRYNNYESDVASDRWLRMRVRNPYRWNAFDDYDWNSYGSWNNNFYSPFNYSWNSYFNGYWNWNSNYNPYCRNVIVVNPKGNPNMYNNVRKFSLGSYTNTNYNNNNRTFTKASAGVRLPGSGVGGGGYNNSNNNSGSLGNSLKKVFSSNSTVGKQKGYNKIAIVQRKIVKKTIYDHVTKNTKTDKTSTES